MPETQESQDDDMRRELKRQLTKDEGVRLKPYLDCCGKYWRDCTCRKKGKLTVGIGRNLDDVGISLDEANTMVDNDIRKARMSLEKVLPGFLGLSVNRRMVLINMTFNLGLSGLLEFKKMLAACYAGDWQRASDEMLDSQWAFQVGRRATDLAAMMRKG